MNEYQNIDLVCVCGKPFVWEKGEQIFMQSLLTAGKIQSITQPKRCPACREKRRAEKEAREVGGLN